MFVISCIGWLADRQPTQAAYDLSGAVSRGLKLCKEYKPPPWASDVRAVSIALRASTPKSISDSAEKIRGGERQVHLAHLK
jgi:hypothetical protein